MPDNPFDDYEDKTIIAPTTPHNQGYEQSGPAPHLPPEQGKVRFLAGFHVLKDDPNFWNNILLGGLIMLIPFVGSIVLLGWCAEAIQRHLRKQQNPIPKINFGDFGYYLGKGIPAFLAQLVYSLILSVVLLIVYALFFLLPFLFLGSDGSGSGIFIVFAIIGSLILIPLSLIGIMLLLYVTFIGMVTEDFKSALQIKTLLRFVKATWLKFLLGFLVIYLVSIPLTMLGMLVCLIGVYPVVVVCSFMMFYFIYQIYFLFLSKGGTPLEMKLARPLPSEAMPAS